MENPKKEIERLSKENFNLKLRLHYFEQQFGNGGGEEFEKIRNEQEERQINYRVLLEEAKTVVAGLQEDVAATRSKSDRLEAEHKRLQYHVDRLEEQLKAEEEKRLNAERYIESQRLDYEDTLAKAQSDKVVEVGELRDKLNKEQEARLRAEEDALRSRSEIDILENDRRTGAWQSLNLQNQLAKAEEDARHLRAVADKLENEKKRGEWQSSISATDISKLQGELRHWKYEAEKLETEKRRGEWRASSSVDTQRAEDEAHKWRVEVERLEAEKRHGGWQNLVAEELAKMEAELKYWKDEAERLRSSGTPIAAASEELQKWYGLARSITGKSTDFATFSALVRSMDAQRKRGDDAKTWEVFAESITGSRTIEALEAYINDIQSRFERVAKRMEFQQQQKPANVHRVQQAEEKLRVATERLEKLENARKERLDEYVRRIAELEDENRRLVKEITDLKFSKGVSSQPIRPALGYAHPPRSSTNQAFSAGSQSLQSSVSGRRGSTRLDDLAMGAIKDLNYAASLMRRKNID